VRRQLRSGKDNVTQARKPLEQVCYLEYFRSGEGDFRSGEGDSHSGKIIFAHAKKKKTSFGLSILIV